MGDRYTPETDISNSTNLAVSAPVTLTGDTIGWDSRLVSDSTWGSGSDFLWAFNINGATNPTITFTNGLITLSGTTSISALAVTTSTDFNGVNLTDTGSVIPVDGAKELGSSALSWAAIHVNGPIGYSAGPGAFYLDINVGTSFDFYTDLVADIVLNFDGSGAGTGTFTYKSGTDIFELDTALTIGGNLIIPNNGYIGSVSDTDAIQISAGGRVALTQNLTIAGGTGLTEFGIDINGVNGDPTAGQPGLPGTSNTIESGDGGSRTGGASPAVGGDGGTVRIYSGSGGAGISGPDGGDAGDVLVILGTKGTGATAGADGEFTVGDGSSNVTAFSATGDVSFVGSAGFYPRFLTQSAEPAAGTGATQLDTSEMCIWKDSDDNKIYFCFNDGGTVKIVEAA